MRIHAKTVVLGLLATIGVGTAAIAAQPSERAAPQQHQQMMNGNMMGRGQMMNMMANDPKMRQQMTDMMNQCSQMMKQMGGMMGAPKK